MFDRIVVGIAYLFAGVGIAICLACLLVGFFVLFLVVRSWFVNRGKPKKIVPDWLASISQR